MGMMIMGEYLSLSRLCSGVRTSGWLLFFLLVSLVPTTRGTLREELRDVTGSTTGGGGMILNSLQELDDITSSSSRNNVTLQRKGNVDVVIQHQQDEDDEETIGICRLDYLVGLSRVVPTPPDGTLRRVATNQLFAVEGAAAIALAAHHLNTGNGSIVPQLAGLNNTCDIRFTVDTIDSQWNQKLAVDQIIDLTTATTGGANKRRPPCAILGSVFSRVTMSTAMITSMKGYVQMSYSTATELEDRMLFPLSTRILPSLSNNVAVLIRYLRHELGVKHLAVLHTDTRESQSYSVALQQAAVAIAPDLQIQSFDIPDQITPQIMQQAVTKLKQTRYTYFLAAVKVGHFDALWNETLSQGIAGTGRHVWFTPVGDGYFSSQIYERGNTPPPIWTTYPGIHMIRLSGFWKHPIYDKLVEALQELGQSQMDRNYLLSKLPIYPDVVAQNRTNIFEPIVGKNFLQLEPTKGMVTWAYDSAIATGLAACRAASATAAAAAATATKANYFDGKTHFNAITSMPTFHGSTGNITFDSTTGTRLNPRYQIVNIQMDEAYKSNSTHVAFREVTTGMYLEDEYVHLRDAIYNDGTTTIPKDLPPPLDVNHHSLSLALLITCLSMCGIVVVLAVGVSIWVLIHKDARVVLSAQPIFLHLLAIGVAIVGLAIIPLSIDKNGQGGGGGGVEAETEAVVADEGSGNDYDAAAAAAAADASSETTDAGSSCDVACRSFPWLISIGFSLTFSALWAKTHRVNKLLQNQSFRRVTVQPVDVAKPMILVLCANVLVLTLWTTLSPLHCETEIMVWDEFDRPIETRGYCTSSDGGNGAGGDLGYLIALAIINLGPLVFAVYEAYVARNISTEYAETDYILKALVVICLVCFIGIPVLVIAYDNPAAYFFVLSAILFVVGMSILILIFGPKLLAYYDLNLCSDNSNSNSRNLPLRFSREKSSRRGSTSNASSVLALGSQVSVSDLSHVSGLMILSHPKKQEELEEENNQLRVQNEEMKKSLKAANSAAAATAATSAKINNSTSFAEDSISEEKPFCGKDPQLHQEIMQETIERLQEENEELKRKLLEVEKNQRYDGPECAK